MTHWRTQLRDADPLALVAQAEMPDADAVRRVVVASARAAAAPRAARWGHSALAMAATIVLVVCVGLIAGRRLAQVEPLQPAGASVSPLGDVRQLQFATPGGTRIIWIFNPDLNLNETTP